MAWNMGLGVKLLLAIGMAAGLAAPFRQQPVRPALTTPVFDPVTPNEVFDVPLPPPPACDGGRVEVQAVTRSVARRLAAKRIPYNSDALADCSGMVHRVLEALDARCDDVARPDLTTARSARALAAWYAHQGLLTTVLGPQDADDALTPGALVFFGAPGRADVPLEEIFHVGVVYDVTRNERGEVESYLLFHGRRPGKVASITRWHRRDADPPLGNGREQLVAVAWPSPDLMPAGAALLVADAFADRPLPEIE
jgi:hypothetical protein